MKEHSGSINSIFFNQFQTTSLEQYHKFHFVKKLHTRLHAYQDLLETSLAIFAIGTIILAATYFFFLQLAEYGW